MCNAENRPGAVYDFRDSTDDVSGVCGGGCISAKSRCHRFGKTGRSIGIGKPRRVSTIYIYIYIHNL